MDINVGNLDRIIRGIIGIGILSLAFVGDDSIRWVGAFGFIPLTTAVIASCPLYSMLHINSCEGAPHRS